MTALIDEICPDYVGDDRLVLQLGPNSLAPQAFDAVDVLVDYDGALPNGVVTPLELTIVAPSSGNFVRKIYSRAAPTVITFQPKEGGRHIVRLAEVGHNRWYGYIAITVSGESAATD